MEYKQRELTAQDWRAMYMLLVDGIAKSMDKMPLLPEVSGACEALVKASQDAEDYYIAALGWENAERADGAGKNSRLHCQKNLGFFIKNRENPLDSRRIFFYYIEAVRKGEPCPQHCDEPGDCSERR